MDGTYTESDSQDLQENMLPEIPNGFVRLTHFLSEDTAKKLVNGETFSYATQGVLSSTTDAPQNNEEISKLVRTAKIGELERAGFGNAIVFIDIDSEESKDRSRIGRCRDTSIPNHNILGYLLRSNPGELVKNKGYNPIKNKLSYLPAGPLPIQQAKQDTPSVSEVEEGTSDVW